MTFTRHIPTRFRGRLALVLLAAALFAPGALRAQSGKENSEFKLAVGLYNDGMYDLAAEQLKSFIGAYPGTAQGIEARFTLGQTQMKLKRYDEARVTFQNFALSYVEHPKAPEAWLNVAEAFHALGNDREAATAYERVRVFHPKSEQAPEALVKAAQLYRAAGDRESARKALRAVLQDYPSSASVLPARLAIGELYAEEGQIDQALREARRVSASDAPAAVRASALFSIGRMQASASLLADAEATFRSLPTLYPGTPVVGLSLVELGILEARAGRLSAAAEHFRSVAGNEKLGDSLRAAAQLRLGSVLLAQRDASGAHKAFTQSSLLGKGTSISPEALVRAADAAAAAGQWDRSLTAARAAVALGQAPWTGRALVLAATAAASLRQYDDAAQSYRSLLAAGTAGASSDEVLYRLGTLHLNQRNDYRSAIASFDELVRGFPQSARCADAAYGTADAQMALGDADGALKTYLDIQKRYPGAERSTTLDSLIDAARRKSAGKRDEALRKLTRLIGEVLLDTSKAELAFQLGMIYLNDLGDDAAAANQFSAALASGLAGTRRAEASFLRASALRNATTASDKESAIAAYDAYLREFPAGARVEEALYERTILASGTLKADARAAALREFTSRYPSSPYAGAILLELGKGALDQGRAGDAIPSFRAAAQVGTPAVRNEALWLSAAAFEQAGNPDSAFSAWSAITTGSYVDHRTVDALLASAEQALARKRPALAKELSNRLRTEFSYTPAAARAMTVAAQAEIESGDGAAAEAILRPLVDDASPFELREDALVVAMLAKAVELKGDRQSAAALYHRVVASTNDASATSKALYALGALARAEGSNERAASYFAQAASLGGSAGATPEIADLLFQTEQYAQAATQYAALAAASDSAGPRQEFRRKAVIATFRQDNVTVALAMAAEFTKSFGKVPAAQAEFAYERGLSFYRKQDYTAARKAFKEVADDFAGTRFGPWGEYYQAKILEVTGALDQAAKEYSRILEKRAGSDVVPRAHLSLGNMHFNAERYEDAIRHYQSITASPEAAGEVLPYAMNNLIEAYESTKLYDNALRTARDYIARYPNDENILDKKIKIGTLYTKTGYYDQAILQFQGIMDEAGSLLEAEIRYDIGEAYYYKGEYQQAILEFLKVPYLVTRQGKVDWTATSFYMAGQSYEKMSRFDDAIGMYQQIVDRPGIDATFKAAARKEIDRVTLLTKKGPK